MGENRDEGVILSDELSIIHTTKSSKYEFTVLMQCLMMMLMMMIH